MPEEPGHEVAKDRQSALEENMRGFYAPLGDGNAARVKPLIYKPPDRVGTLRLIRGGDNQILWGLNKRFWMYIVTAGKIVIIAQKIEDDTLTWEDLEEIVPAILACLDKDSKNVAMESYMVFEEHVNMFFFYDGGGHGLANAILNGLFGAGHRADVNKLAVLRNFKAAPFHSFQWYRKLQGVGLEAARTVSKNDKLARFAFRQHCRDRGLTRPEETDEPANRRALYILSSQPPTGESFPSARWKRL